MDMIVTTAGHQALINALKTGTETVVVSKIGVGSGKYMPTESQTALISETKRLPIVEGGSAGDHYIHVAYQDPSEDVYSVHEIGLFLEDGTLFAVTSQTNAILQKTANATALLVIDIAFADIDVSSLTFGDVSFSNPEATAANSGVVTLATGEEVAAGTNAQKAVTPATLLSRTATAYRAGLVELATDGEATAGTDAARAVTPASAKAAIDARAASNADALAGISTTQFVTPSSLRAVKASSTLYGMVELATADEVVAGTDDSRAVTPAGLKAMFRMFEITDNSFSPTTDSVMQLGTSGRRYTNIYATNGTINTSDEREKRNINPVEDAVLDAWARVNFCQFLFKDGDRVHVGVIAQRVAEAFETRGLDAHDYGLFCEDKDEDGRMHLGIRYSEALALECALQRRETERLKARIEELEKGVD